MSLACKYCCWYTYFSKCTGKLKSEKSDHESNDLGILMITFQESGEIISPDDFIAKIVESSEGSFQLRLKDGTTKKISMTKNASD